VNRCRAAPALSAVAVAGAFHLGPSVVSLGQWTPLRAVPWCRWRGPAVPLVAITFDDGPSPDTTPLVLDRLDELGLTATFFCLGAEVHHHVELVRELVDRGHQVETHGHDHDHHFARGPRWVARDLDRSLAALASAGVSPRWFRPPYGQTTGGTLLAARRRHLAAVLWSSWGREWAAPDAAAVAARVVGSLSPGAIVLLHDTDILNPPGSTRRVVEALGPIAEALDARHLRAVRLDELVAP